VDFEYPEDEQFFDKLLESLGGLANNYKLFDFRDLDIKRKEYRKIRNKVFKKLIATYGNVCQLQCHEDCTGTANEIDHLIPLSSNVLNKKLRTIMGKSGKKTPTQSFGSNNESNFVLACKRCNAAKKVKLLTKDMLQNIHDAKES